MSGKDCDCTAWTFIFVAWIAAVISTLGSLFFSEIMGLPPCVLCWYQRIAMYPQVFLLIAGLFPVSRTVLKFSAPLALVGLIISIYHNLLYYKILPESAAPCVQGISCTTVQIQWLGFITIPFLSFVGFTIILIFLYLTHRILPHEK